MTEMKTFDQLIRIGIVILLLSLSFLIVAPFVMILIWSLIIAVALQPAFNWLTRIAGGKKWIATAVFFSVMLTMILIPAVLLTRSTIEGYHDLREAYSNGSLTIPPPTEDVREWPLIGEKTYALWDAAYHNIREVLQKNSGALKSAGKWILSTITSLGITVLQFMVSLIIAGVMLYNAGAGEKTALTITKKLAGEKAEEYIRLVSGTIRSVVQGVLGIALIQAIASIILFASFGIPVASFWGLLILILAIVQLPVVLILAPIAIYVFSIYDTTQGIVFIVFAAIISLLDNILKPIFLGRGVDIPMLIILIGAIGGMIAFGILGLFVGSVILAISYKLFIAWTGSLKEG